MQQQCRINELDCLGYSFARNALLQLLSSMDVLIADGFSHGLAMLVLDDRVRDYATRVIGYGCEPLAASN